MHLRGSYVSKTSPKGKLLPKVDHVFTPVINVYKQLWDAATRLAVIQTIIGKIVS
jgi:hypothetical protein